MKKKSPIGSAIEVKLHKSIFLKILKLREFRIFKISFVDFYQQPGADPVRTVVRLWIRLKNKWARIGVRLSAKK
jgi:hypothetical protein